MPTDEDLEKANLSLEDMPLGWTIGQLNEDETNDDDTFCPSVEPVDLDILAKGKAEVACEQSEFGPYFAERLARYFGRRS